MLAFVAESVIKVEVSTFYSFITLAYNMEINEHSLPINEYIYLYCIISTKNILIIL